MNNIKVLCRIIIMCVDTIPIYDGSNRNSNPSPGRSPLFLSLVLFSLTQLTGGWHLCPPFVFWFSKCMPRIYVFLFHPYMSSHTCLTFGSDLRIGVNPTLPDFPLFVGKKTQHLDIIGLFNLIIRKKC